MRSTIIRFAIRSLATGAAVAASLEAASAVEPFSAAAAQPAPTVYTRAAGGAAGPLISRVQNRGEIRVIVGLDLALRQSSSLSADAAVAQRQALDAAQGRVALRALGSATTQGVVKFDTIPFVSLNVTPDQLARLLKDPEVVSLQEDVPVPPTLSQSVPLINGDDVWAKGVDGTGRVVAILDTGVAKAHPMLAGKVVSEACYSSNNPAYPSTSVCPGGVTDSTAPGSGADCPSTVDGCFHGTHVASIAAGRSSTLSGVARGSKVVAIQVFSRFESAYCGGSGPCVLSFTTDQIKGLERVLALKSSLAIDSVNMSLGGGAYSAYCDANQPAETAAINNLRAAGVATAIASGNNGYTGSISSPSCISSAIRVGATTKTDFIASYSNHSPLIDLLAPGSSIYAALPPTSYGFLSGSSMATPHVAGSFALLRQAKPSASVSEVLGALSCTGVPISLRESGGVTDTKPRIDLLAAYNFLKTGSRGAKFTFKKAKDADTWTPVVGAWKVDKGFYQGAKQTGVDWVGSATPNCATSLKITAAIQRVLPGEKTSFGNSGIIYKAQIASDGSVSGYFAAYNACPTKKKACTGKKKDPVGLANLFRFSDMSLVTGAGTATVLCTKQINVNVGKINDIEITSTGTQQTYKLNGKKVCSVADAASTAGAVAVVGYSTSKKAKPLMLDELQIAITAADVRQDDVEADAAQAAGAPVIVNGADIGGSTAAGEMVAR